MLGNLFLGFTVLVVLPLLLSLLIGWWVGKQVAFRTLSLRGAATALAVLGLVPFFFWYPSMGVFIDPGMERLAKDIPGHMRAYANSYSYAAVPAVMAAGISWVLNLEEYQKRRRREKPE